MMELIRELYLKNRSLVTGDYQESLRHIDTNEIPLEYHRFPSGDVVWNSWIVPQRWDVQEAYVEIDDERIIDFHDHPLHLPSYCPPFEGLVDRDELIDHCITHQQDPDAIPFHFRNAYRPWDRDWGFCVSQSTVDSLKEGEYHVRIDTKFADDELIVAEHHVDGRLDETVVLVAHLDHPGMANDDLAGVSVGCEIMRRIHGFESLRYSYKFLIVPEIIGSVAYLEKFPSEVERMMYGVFLEMPGNDNRLLLQNSFEADSQIDSAAKKALELHPETFETDTFRSQVGNDELVFEAPGVEVPMISISRFPYDEYHTHFDSPTIIHEEKLESYVNLIINIISIIETDVQPQRKFDGLPALSHPKYDLYIEPSQVLKQQDRSDLTTDVSDFQNRILRELDGSTSALNISEKYELPFDFVLEYLEKLEEKELITTVIP